MSSFTRDVAKLAAAPIITQILSVLLTPIMTRLYSPQSFGIFQLFGSISNPLCVFATMGFHSAILIAEKEEDRINLIFICFSISILFSTFIGSVFWFNYDKINSLINIDQISIIVWVLPLSLLLHGFYLTLRYWNLRIGEFRQTSIGEIFRNIGNYFIVLPAGYLNYATPSSLIFGSLCSSLSTVIILFFGEINLFIKEATNYVRIKKIKYLIVRYKKFPIFNTSIDLLGRFSSEMPVYLFAFFFQQSVIGYYALGLRILRLPVYYLGSSIGEVYYQRGALDKNGDTLLLKRLLKITFILSLPFFATITLIGDDLFEVIFGNNWKEAGQYSQILSFYIFIKLLTSLATYLTNILEKQEYNLVYNLVDIALICLGIWIGGYFRNVFVSLILILLLSGGNSLAFGYYFYFIAGIRLAEFWSLIKKPTALILLFSVITFICTKIFYFNTILSLIVSLLILIVNYYFILLLDSELNNMVKRILHLMKTKYISSINFIKNNL